MLSKLKLKSFGGLIGQIGIQSLPINYSSPGITFTDLSSSYIFDATLIGTWRVFNRLFYNYKNRLNIPKSFFQSLKYLTIKFTLITIPNNTVSALIGFEFTSIAKNSDTTIADPLTFNWASPISVLGCLGGYI